MRLFTTIFLILCTATLSYWLVLDINSNNTEPTLDKNGAVIPGKALFDNPAILDRDSITISKKGFPEHSFRHTRNQIWNYTTPHKDRVSHSFFIPLLAFTTSAKVVEAIPLNEIDLADFGLKEDWIKVSISDINNEVAASYKIGINSSWRHRVAAKDDKGQDVSQDIPCVYVIKEDEFADNMLYLVSDSTFGVHSLFANDFGGFRDHRPFALNLNFMEEISIKQANKEIVIDHSRSNAPWRISKPLTLAMDPKALSKLFADISNLKALKLHPSGSVTLPQEADGIKQITVKNFDSDEKTTLTIYPPTDESATTTYATVSDRDIVFELPRLPLKGYTSAVNSLPSSINELRSRNMINLNRANVRGFILRHRTKPPIMIARPAPGSNYELLAANGKRVAPNDVAIANLLAIISKEPVKDFVTDAATDLTLYNFHDPILTIDILSLSGSPQKLLFARDGEKIYAYLQQAHRKNDLTEDNKDTISRTVWEVNQESFIRIARNESEWKSNNVWNLVKNDIIQFSIHQRGGKQVIVNYDYLADTANAQIDKQDVTDKLNPIQAKFFINTNTQLNARRRLGPHNAQAIEALKNPLARVTITSQLYDELAMPTETLTHTISIAKPSETARRIAYYYAKSSNDPDYFTITPATYHKLMVNVFAEE